MLPSENSAREAEKATLVARVDQRVIPALDRIARTNEVNAASLMSQFLADIANTVEFLDAAQGGSFTNVEDWLSELVVRRCRGATPQALRAVGDIWYRAAEKLSTRSGGSQ